MTTPPPPPQSVVELLQSIVGFDTVNANISGREYPDIVVLPRHILRAGNSLWIVDDNNILRNRQVTILRTGGEEVFVTAGLDEGDRVSLTAVDASLTGSAVTVNQSTPTDQLRQGTPLSLPEEPATAVDETATAAVTP